MFFPFLVPTQSRIAFIVGGGEVAARRAEALLESSAEVIVCSPTFHQRLLARQQDAALVLHQGVFVASEWAHLEPTNMLCVVAATNDSQVNLAVSRWAKALNIPVNVADAPEHCDFIFPAMVRQGAVMIALSNQGGSPLLSKVLRQKLQESLPSQLDELAHFFRHQRGAIKKAFPDAEQRQRFAVTLMDALKASHTLIPNTASTPIGTDAGSVAQGPVFLVGAGPGDPELLTLKAFRIIQQAEVVLYDRLVSDAVMALVPAAANKVYVGKRRSEHSVPQPSINQLLADYAQQGYRVVRLKGGDPFIFGRGGEEIETLVEQGVNFEVVPGISAANGCSGYAGIPLTHRDYAQSVQFVTAQLIDGELALDWDELSRPGKTLVFYMGLKTVPLIAENLIAAGVKPTLPVALVEKGTTPEQRVHIARLETVSALTQQRDIKSPTLFIVGEVVQLADRLSWFQPLP